MPSPTATVDLVQRLLAGDSGLGTIPELVLDSGTATASSDAATINAVVGKVTTEAKSTAAAGTYTITLTNSYIAATSRVFVSAALNSGGAGVPVVTSVVPGAGSCTITVQNNHATAAFDGAHALSFLVL